MSEWRDIATAPEKRWILVYDGDLNGKYLGFFGCNMFPVLQIDGVWYEHSKGVALINTNNKSTIHPTHWMPLPEPPNE